MKSLATWETTSSVARRNSLFPADCKILKHPTLVFTRWETVRTSLSDVTRFTCDLTVTLSAQDCLVDIVAIVIKLQHPYWNLILEGSDRTANFSVSKQQTTDFGLTATLAEQPSVTFNAASSETTTFGATTVPRFTESFFQV